MGTEVGRIDLGLDVNKKSFNQQLNGIAGGAEKSVRSAFSGLGKMIGLTLGTAAVVSFTKSCLELGSNLTEVQNVVDTVFPSMNNQVNNFAKNAMDQFGLSETVAKKYTGTLGAMSKSMGFSEQAALSMAEGVTGLSGDVASFYNISSDEAYTKLKSIWTGETESLKELGVIMTQTNLDQYAMNNGFGKTTSSMDEQTKTMLRYQYVTSALAAAQGDFVKTSDSWANQVRVLSLRFDSLKATLGQGFINLLTPLVQGLNTLIGKLQGAANAFKTFTELVTGKTIETSTGAIATNALEATDNILGMGDAAVTSAKKATHALAGFDELNNLSGGSTGSGSTAGTTTDSSGASSDGSAAVSDSNSSLLSAFEGFKEKIQPTIDALDRLKGALKPIGKFVFDNIKSFYEDLLVPIGEWALGKGLPGLIDAFINLLSDIDWPKLSGAIGDFNKAIAPLAIAVGTGFVNFVTDLSEVLKPVLATTADLLAESISAVADALGKANPKDYEDVGYGIGVIATAIAGIKIVSGLPAFLLGVGLGLQSLLAGLSNLAYMNPVALPALFDLLGLDEWLDDLYLKLPEWIRSLWEGFWQVILDVLKDVFNYDSTFAMWSEVARLFKEAFDGTADKWYEIGGNIVLGILGGIVGAFGFVAEPIFDLLGAIIKNIKDVFGINSPAEEMKPYGEYIMQGLIQGIKDGWLNGWADFKTWLALIPGKISIAAGSLKSLFTTKGAQIISGIKSGWASGWTDFKAWLATLPGKIGSAVGSLFNTGANLVRSFINGLKSIHIPKLDISLGTTTAKILGKEIDVPSLKVNWYANGGYVGANQPQLAMIGDNKREGEIVSPESKFQEMLNAAAKLSGGGISEEVLYRVMSRVFRENQLMLVPDGNGLFKLVKIASKEYYDQTGKNAFDR